MGEVRTDGWDSFYSEVIPEIRRLRLDVSNLYLELGWLLEKVDKVYRQSIVRLTALETEQERRSKNNGH